MQFIPKKQAFNMFSNNLSDKSDKSKIVCTQYQTSDDESFIRTDDEEADDMEDDHWNTSSKLWSYINR